MKCRPRAGIFIAAFHPEKMYFPPLQNRIEYLKKYRKVVTNPGINYFLIFT